MPHRIQQLLLLRSFPDSPGLITFASREVECASGVHESDAMFPDS